MQHSSLLALAVLLLFVSGVTAQSVSPLLARAQEQDRKALLSLKSVTMAAGSSRLRAWKDTTKPCDAKGWPYVTCTAGRVTGLNLANLGLAGTLPDDLRRASELVTLNLAGNKFTATASGVTIPAKWVNPQTFRKLKTINLSNNNFIAKLPTLDYNGRSSLNIFRSLEVLDLSGNKFFGDAPGASGGVLPRTWLNDRRVLRSIKILDLSSNALGYRTVATTTGVHDSTTAYSGSALWCTGEVNDGWCPSGTPTPGTLASLEIFDLSNNDIKGALAVKWPLMMPRLTQLILAGNDFWKDGASAFPAPLPDTWSGGAKRGFPALQQLVLYPGNAYLCSLPDDSGDYRDVNLEGSFKVLDTAEGQWGVENPAICPVDTTATITINAPTTANTISIDFDTNGVYGWTVTVSKSASDFNGLDKYVPVSGYTSRYRRVWADNASPVTVTVPYTDGASQETLCSAGKCALPLTGAEGVTGGVTAGDKFKVTVILTMVDGGEVEATQEVTAVAACVACGLCLGSCSSGTCTLVENMGDFGYVCI